MIRAQVSRTSELMAGLLAVVVLTVLHSANSAKAADTPPAVAAAERQNPPAGLRTGIDPGFMTLAGQTLDSPVVLSARVSRISKVSRDQAVGLGIGGERRLITADVESVIQAPAAIPARIRFLADWYPQDGGDAFPNLKKLKLLLFLQTVPDRDDHYVLTGRESLVIWQPEIETKVRTLSGSALAPPVKGFVARDVAGLFAWGDRTQILIDGTDGRRVTADVPAAAEEPIQVAFDDTGQQRVTVQPASMIWYQLACVLPQKLPDTTWQAYRTMTFDPRAAYADFRARLGPCR